MSYIVNKDCFEEFDNIEDRTVDLVLVDLPYGQTACKWDISIDLNLMWKRLKRICKRDAIYVFFTTTKYGYEIIHSNPRWFRYDIVWEKSRRVGFLSANKMPLRQHEMIYVFSDVNSDDLDNSRNLGLRDYFKNVHKFIGKPKKDIIKKIGQSVDHCFRFKSTQFGLPTQKTYDALIKEYHIDQMEGFRTLDELKNEWGEPTYNPQKTEGKPYTATRKNGGCYGDKMEHTPTENKGDRHPTSILHIPEAPAGQDSRQHEMLYVFSDVNSDDLDNSRNLGLRDYFKNMHKFIGKTLKQITTKIGRRAEHCFYYSSTQFGLPTQKTYDELIKEYHIDQMEGFRTLDKLKNEWVTHGQVTEPTTYNPQKTEGNPYKTKGFIDKACCYYETMVRTENINKGDRHPTSIVKFNNPKKSIHRTQKPVELCEWLIKTYSNEGDTVLDFTMGSGTTIVACINTKREYIGIEKDPDIFEIAEERIKNTIIQKSCESACSDSDVS